MKSTGIDIGSTTTKIVLLEDDQILFRKVSPSGNLPAETGRALFAEALETCGLAREAVDVIATTGYGRRLVDFGDVVLTEIKACALGVLHHQPPHGAIHTIIDVGGQDTKVIALDDEGEIEDFSMNDKCAAGTGRFLEMLAQKMDLSYEDFVEEARAAETLLQMNSTCAVFAESEVVGLLARGESKGDIAAAAHEAIANRVASMIRRVGQCGAYCFVGGGARNRALVQTIEENLGEPVWAPEHAQVVVALGAALGAQRKREKHLARMERTEGEESP